MLLFQAYLSLPEGTASVVGLKAMMTDHYNVMVRLDYNFKFSPDFGFYLEFVLGFILGDGMLISTHQGSHCNVVSTC